MSFEYFHYDWILSEDITMGQSNFKDFFVSVFKWRESEKGRRGECMQKALISQLKDRIWIELDVIQD